MEFSVDLFDKETVENISKMVQDKMRILNTVSEFKEKDKDFGLILEDFENSLSKEKSNQFDNLMRLNYQIESYYFTLAYFLGMNHGSKLTKLQ